MGTTSNYYYIDIKLKNKKVVDTSDVGVGIAVEKRLAFGLIVLKVITRDKKNQLVEHLKKIGQPVTTFSGEGISGPVSELYIVCNRKNLKCILGEIRGKDPNAFYITEQVRDINKILRPTYQPTTGWRAIFKKE